MRQHLTWPHFRPQGPAPKVRPALSSPAPPPGVVEPRASPDNDRWQTFKDKLAVVAVLVLILATITVFVLYLVQQSPRFGTGELTGFATPAPGAVQQVDLAGTEPAAGGVAGTGLSRIALILISTVVEMAIFVALGLYLRHDMKRDH